MATHAARQSGARALRSAVSGAPILASKITAPGVEPYIIKAAPLGGEYASLGQTHDRAPMNTLSRSRPPSLATST